MRSDWLVESAASYDTVAASYAEMVRGAAAGHPYLRSALSLFADQVKAVGGGPVVDVGCGPGDVTAYLHGLGVDASGIDLSPRMIEIARRDHPGMRFDVGSMTDLAHPAGSVTGLLSWQTLIHAPDDDVLAILEQFRRVIRPGGALQLLFHVGDDSWLKTEGYGGHPMNVHVYRRQPRQMTAWLRDAAFEVDAQMLLGPGGKSAQAILFARRQP